MGFARSQRRLAALVLLAVMGIACLVVSEQTGFAPVDALFRNCRRWPDAEVTARKLFGEVFLLPPTGKIINAGMKTGQGPRYFWLAMQCDTTHWHDVLKQVNRLSPATMGIGTTVQSLGSEVPNIVDIRPMWWPRRGERVLDSYSLHIGSDAVPNPNECPNNFLIGFSSADNRLYLTFAAN